MTEKTETPDYDSIRKWQYAIVGARYLKEENMPAAQMAVRGLLEAWSLGEEGKNLLETFNEGDDPRDIQRTLGEGLKHYVGGKNKLSAIDLIGFYSPQISKHKEAEQIRQEFGKFGGESLESIVKKHSKAAIVLKNKQLYGEGEVKAAESTAEEYKAVANFIQIFDEESYAPLREKIETKLTDEGVAMLAKPEEKELPVIA